MIRKRCTRRGQGLVEFALSLTLLITMMCGIFEFSWVFYNYAYLNNVVSKAARMGVPLQATGTNNDAAISAAVTSSRGGLPIQAPTIRLTDQTGNTTTSRAAGNILIVEAQMDYASITPLASLVQMSSLSRLKASCAVVLE